MAIDYIIGALQLLSAAVNVLALASFWITPALRTTANRFVINLLIVNIVGCLCLTPALWLHGGLIPTVHSETQPIYDNEESLNSGAAVIPSASSLSPSLNSLQDNFIDATSSTIKPTTFFLEIFEQNSDEDVEIIADIHEDDTKSILPNRTDEQPNNTTNHHSPTKNIQYSDCTRFWGFDLVAALGGLSVMLVVGDTWCAVTDPLRYHSRISGLKSWILIVATWFVSILFCIASALRRDCRLITTEITSTLQKIASSSVQHHDIDEIMSTASSNRTTSIVGDSLHFDDLYNLIYSCTFFVVIILLPICLVCAMYWKIFSEARQNGLRMRQNGSSPLLQSALNLATASAHLPPPTQLDHSCSVIGEEDSDNATDSLASSRSNVIQFTLRRNSMAATTSPVHHVSIKDPHFKSTHAKLHSSAHKVNSLSSQSSAHRRYLEIPNFHEIQNYQSHSNRSNKNQHSELNGQDVSPNVDRTVHKHLLFEHRIIYDPLTADVANELRQVHSTPDLQKSIQSELSMLTAGHRINGTHSSDKKIHRSGSINNHGNAITPLPTRRPSMCTPPKALSYMTSIRHRLSNASSIFKYREESRAARISILVVIMFLFSYFPYGLLVLLQGRATFYANSSCLGVLFLLIANITSPFIFAYRNRRVRRGVCRLFGVDAKTNERLQKQRMITHGNLRSNSCREQKRKTKVVRINRNSAKSASFSSGSIDPTKYTPVPLIDPAATEHHAKYGKCVESAVCLNEKIDAAVVPLDDVCIEIDELTNNQNANAYIPPNVINFISNCTNNSSNCKRDQSDSMDDVAVAKYVKDIVNHMNGVHDVKNENANHQTSHRIPIHLNHNNNLNLNNNNNNNTIQNIHSSGKNMMNANVNNKTHCNLSPTTGANVIKQKISLLRRVCKHTAKKRTPSNCSSPTSPCTDSQFYFDSNHSIKAVNV